MNQEVQSDTYAIVFQRRTNLSSPEKEKIYNFEIYRVEKEEMTSVQSSGAVDRHVSSSSPPIMTSSSTNPESSPIPTTPPSPTTSSNNNNVVHNTNSNDCGPSPVPSSPVSSARPGSVSPTSSQIMSPSNNSNNNVLNLTTSNNNNSSTEREESINKEPSNASNNNLNNNSSNNINTSTSSPSAASTTSSSSTPPPPPSSSSPSSVHQSPIASEVNVVVQQQKTASSLPINPTNGHMATGTITSHHVNPTSTRPLRLRRVNHSDEIVSGFGKLLKNESLTDVTISCSGGINIKAHRIVLSTFSPYFKSIFESSPFIDTPWTYPVIVMKDYGYTELKAIIEFIYKGEVSVPRDKLSSVLATAKSLEVSGLADLKLDSYGINSNPSSSVVHNHHHSHPSNSSNLSSASHGPLPLVNGSSAAALAAAASLGSLTGIKRSSDLETSLYGSSVGNNKSASSLHGNTEGNNLHGNNHDSAAVSLAKKLRLLDSPPATNTNSVATDLSLGSSLSSLQQLQQYAAASGIDLNSLESVRNLLQQPPRVTSFLQQLRQQTQSPLNNNRSSPTVSNTPNITGSGSPTPTRMSNVSLQQIINSQKAAAGQQQQLNNGNNTPRLNPHSLQLQQQHLKQQILQQQLLRSKNHHFQSGVNNNQGQGALVNAAGVVNFSSNGNSLNQRSSSLVTNNNSNSTQIGNNNIPFMQFQQRIRQQIQEKQRSLALLGQAAAANNGNLNLGNKPLLQKHLTLSKDLSKLTQSGTNLIKVENPVINGAFNHHSSLNHSVTDDDEVEVIIKEGDEIKLGKDNNGPASESQEMDHDDSDHQRKGSMNDSMIDNDESSENLVVEEDSDHQNNHHSEEMDSENEHGLRNNSHRGINEDDEYEIEIDKDAIFQQQQQLRLQQIQKQQQNYQLQLQLEQEEQEQRLLEYHQSLSQATPSSEGDGDADSSNTGFGFDWQEGFTDDFPHSGKGGDGEHQVNGIGNQRSTPLATPDFLQPRGPGRPRKGNKAQEISPCPECNKVFVRPDVLKLHYRSVHLNERHPCNLCPKIFKWPGDLSKHKRTKHPDKYPPANANNSIVVHH